MTGIGRAAGVLGCADDRGAGRNGVERPPLPVAKPSCSASAASYLSSRHLRRIRAGVATFCWGHSLPGLPACSASAARRSDKLRPARGWPATGDCARVAAVAISGNPGPSLEAPTMMHKRHGRPTRHRNHPRDEPSTSLRIFPGPIRARDRTGRRPKGPVLATRGAARGRRPARGRPSRPASGPHRAAPSHPHRRGPAICYTSDIFS
jgi:hypothetical protein